MKIEITIHEKKAKDNWRLNLVSKDVADAVSRLEAAVKELKKPSPNWKVLADISRGVKS